MIDRPVTVRMRALLVYLFTILLVQLGRYHIGLMFDYVFFLLLIIPILSIAHLFISIVSIKYHQHFDTEHPIKGETLTYTLLLANESHFASARLRIGFRTIWPGTDAELPPLDITLKRGERSERDYSIRCPYRGVYTVGLERLILSDSFGFITISRPVWHRTFYVYPRVIEAEYPFEVGEVSELSTGPNPGASQDYSLFETLVPYRSGESIRHIAWKKFFALGQPYIKSYAKTSQPGVTIYFDLRREGEANPAILEREDCSIEILVALARSFLSDNVPVSIQAFGQSRYRFAGESVEAFERFYSDTVNLMYTNTISPAALYRGDAHHVGLRSAVLFISHILDPEILEILDDSKDAISGTATREVAYILNQSGMPNRERDKSEELFGKMREGGSQVATVSGAGAIPTDLRKPA